MADFNPRSPRGSGTSLPAPAMPPASFQSTLHSRGATQAPCYTGIRCQFQSTLPARGATETALTRVSSVAISIHAPREGSDPASYQHPGTTHRFQSTLPARGATSHLRPILAAKALFQSTLPARGATRGRSLYRPIQCISIHAPREGSDSIYSSFSSARVISIHAPREGSDLGHERGHPYQGGFQSTLPARGATTEGDRNIAFDILFQSTLPSRGATTDRGQLFQPSRFQSTLPLAGSDLCRGRRGAGEQDFNPRSPRGERLKVPEPRKLSSGFQSTLPSRGATRVVAPLLLFFCIFQSTLPSRGATVPRALFLSFYQFQSTLPSRGATRPQAGSWPGQPDFNPRSPRGERPFYLASPITALHFNPRSPRGERRLGCFQSCSRSCDFNPRSPRGERLP